MRESELLGTLLPSSPDFQPIIHRIREKYGLSELSPDDDPIEHIYLDGKEVPLAEFLAEIQRAVEVVPYVLPATVAKMLGMLWRHLVPEHKQQAIHRLYKAAQDIGQCWLNTLAWIDRSIARMLHVHSLTGETEQVPNDWITRVAYLAWDAASGEPMIVAMASQISSPERSPMWLTSMSRRVAFVAAPRHPVSAWLSRPAHA